MTMPHTNSPEHDAPSVRAFHILLSFILIIGVIGIAWYQFANVPYESVFIKNGYQSWSMGLTRHPLWQPPATPDYETFAKVFRDLPPEQPPRSIIYVVCHWDDAILMTMLFTSLYLIPFVFIYHFTCLESFNYVLHFAYWLGITWLCSVVGCFGLWILGGGWGPPFPYFFAFFGMLLGIVLGFIQLAAGKRLYRVRQRPKAPILPVDFSMFEDQTSSESTSSGNSRS